jgi:hypothetical protein
VEDVKYIGKVKKEALFKGSIGLEDFVRSSELRMGRVVDWDAGNQLLVNRDIRAVLMAIGLRVFRSVLRAIRRSPDVYPGHIVKGETGLPAPTFTGVGL